MNKELTLKVIKSFTRLYVDNMNTALEFYESLLGEKCSVRFPYPEVNLELAQIGHFLILAGSKDNLKEFRDTKATIVVDSVLNFKNYILKTGGKIIRDIKKVPTGLNLTMENPDGSIIEYVQFINKY